MKYVTKYIFSNIITLCLSCWVPVLHAETSQAHAAIAEQARLYLEKEYASIGESVEVTIQAPANGSPSCSNPGFALPRREINASGKLFLEVECTENRSRRFYIQAALKVKGTYLKATRAIPSGTLITENMLQEEFGDITRLLAQGIPTLEEARGQVSRHTLSANRIVTQTQLRLPNLIDRGETVNFKITGGGFSIIGQGEAMNEANLGEEVRIRTDKRRILNGTVTDNGMIVVRI